MFFFAFKENETYCRFLEFFSPGPHFVIVAVVIRAVHATGNAFVITATFTYAAVEFENSVGTIFVNTAFFLAFFLLLCKIKINGLPFFCNSRAWPVLRWTLLNSWDRRSEVPSTRLAAFTFLSLRWAHFKCWWVFWAYFAYPDHVGGLCNMGTRICSLPRERRRCSLSHFLQFSLCSFLQESTRMVTSLHEVKATTGWRSPLSMSWRFPPSGSVLWPLS